MKITFVLPNLGIGGGNRVIFEYAHRLQKRGHEVNIVYPLIPPFPKDILRQFGLKGSLAKFLKSRSSKIIHDWVEGLRLIRLPALSPKWIFERKIPDADVIIATEWRTAYAVAGLSEEKGEKYHLLHEYECWEMWNNEKCWQRAEEISKKTGEPIHFAMVDIDTSDLPFHGTRKLIDNAIKLPLKKITVSTWVKELIEKKFNQKVEAVILNGVNFDIFYCENKIWNEKKRILAPYRDAKRKGVEDVIKAFEIIRNKHTDVRFVMFGPMKAEIPDWIEFHENISDGELRRLYCSTDIFVLPSWVEGFGLPAMEAMACKCAVVATNVGGIPDYTIPGKTALVVPPRKPENLAEAIMRLIEDGNLLKNIAEAGYNYIKQFTWENAVNKLEEILKRK